ENARAMAHILTNWPGFAPPPLPTFAPPLTLVPPFTLEYIKQFQHVALPAILRRVSVAQIT
ncbi:hypothetical protein, partial [Paenirhodobacter populi]